MAKFKQEVLETIKSDPDLFAAVSKALGIKPTSLHQTLIRNGATLNQYGIVTLVASHLGKEPEDVVDQEDEGKDHKDTVKAA
jgi:hypothetical protein